MRSWAMFLVICALVTGLASSWPSSGRTAEQSVPVGLTCESYLVFDLEQEAVLAAYNPEQQQPVASLTKLMTSILACERLRFDGRYRLSDSEAKAFGVSTLRVNKLLDLMLVPSNNTACKVVARLISGSEAAFVQEMNAKAAQLGMRSTRFANASGLPGGEQYSTLGDLLILARVALTYPPLRMVMEQDEIELNGKHYDSTLRALARRHPGLLAGKTGYTRAAGRCLVLLYEVDGRQYMIITLKSDGVKDGFRDAELILKHYGMWDGEVGAWD